MDGRHSFRGYTGTILRFDKATEQWRLELYSTPDVFATSNGTEYPFGQQKWTMVGDPCYEAKVNVVTLNINACNTTEFNCEDGYCIDISMRCDGKVNCHDKSG